MASFEAASEQYGFFLRDIRARLLTQSFKNAYILEQTPFNLKKKFEPEENSKRSYNMPSKEPLENSRDYISI
jgi:hypothetical protein